MSPVFDPHPFVVGPEPAQHLRSFRTVEGICDRLRVVALAEQQARDAFLWAAERLDASEDIRTRWRRIAAEEDRHRGMLLDRLRALGGTPGGRRCRADLWPFLTEACDATDFAGRMASAEERGRIGGERLAEALLPWDAESAAIFARIAAEEVDHITLAGECFPRLPPPGTRWPKSGEWRPGGGRGP